MRHWNGIERRLDGRDVGTGRSLFSCGWTTRVDQMSLAQDLLRAVLIDRIGHDVAEIVVVHFHLDVVSAATVLRAQEMVDTMAVVRLWPTEINTVLVSPSPFTF